MEIKSNRAIGIVSTSVLNINNREMRQMCELKNRIDDVLISHKPNAKEKKYISDDDLKLMHAILHVFTEEYSATESSTFDDTLKKFAALEKESAINPGEDDETLADYE